MNLEQLVELRRLLAKSAPGAVKVGDGFYARGVRDGAGDSFAFCGHSSDELACARAALITAAVNALPELLELAERGLRAEVETCGRCEYHDLDEHGHWCKRVCRIEQNMQTHNVRQKDSCTWGMWRAKDGR